MTRCILLCAAFLCASCYHQSASSQPPVQSFNEGIAKVYGRTWVIEPPSTTFISIAYQDGHFVGSSGCNLFSGTMAPRTNGGGLTITPTLSTRRACVPAVMNSEREFLDRLAAVNTMHVTDQEILFNWERGPNHGTLNFVPQRYSFGLSY